MTTHLPPGVKAYLRAIAAKGGAAGTGDAKARTSAQAAAAANARWAKVKKPKRAK